MQHGIIALVLAGLFTWGSASAQPVTFEFQGIINYVDGNISPIALGDTFHGRVSWEPTVGEGSGARMYVVSPPPAVPPAMVTVETASGPVPFIQDPAQSWVVYVMNDYDLSSNGQFIDGLQFFGNLNIMPRNIQIDLRDSTATAFEGVGLPDELSLSAFDHAVVGVTTPTFAFASGSITALHAVPPSRLVDIDIKPGAMPNTVNSRSEGTVPVAILSSPSFDAPGEVDVQSLTFGHDGREGSLRKCDLNGEDVNADGLLDLVCHFDRAAANLWPLDTQGTLEGETNAGQRIRGTDSVRMIH